MKKLWTTLMRFFGFAPKQPTPIHYPIVEPEIETSGEAATRGATLVFEPPTITSKAAIVSGYKNTIKIKKESQTTAFINQIRIFGFASTNGMKRQGCTRVTKIVSELRKKGWHFTTKIETKGGVKDVIYYLQSENETLGI
jgi:hypothetical protein